MHRHSIATTEAHLNPRVLYTHYRANSRRGLTQCLATPLIAYSRDRGAVKQLSEFCLASLRWLTYNNRRRWRVTTVRMSLRSLVRRRATDRNSINPDWSAGHTFSGEREREIERLLAPESGVGSRACIYGLLYTVYRGCEITHAGVRMCFHADGLFIVKIWTSMYIDLYMKVGSFLSKTSSRTLYIILLTPNTYRRS